jgi:aspartyl protease family protein
MVRNFLVLMMLVGMFTSMLGSCFSRSPRSVGSTGVSERSLVAANAGADGGSSSQPSDGTVELKRSSDGHFYADVSVNGAWVHALVDTGASAIALSRDDARKAGIATSIGMPNVVGEGADGDVRGEYVTLHQVTLGNKTVEDLPAVVLNSGETTLLGQSFLSKFASVEIKGDAMVLR